MNPPYFLRRVGSGGRVIRCVSYEDYDRTKGRRYPYAAHAVAFAAHALRS